MPIRVRPHVNPFSVQKEYAFEGFENDNPIVVDVGACKGEFTEALALKFPEKNFIVFEIRVPLAEGLKEKFRDVKNIIVFDGDAGRNFKNILKPSIDRGVLIESIYVNFPDPWFKDRHKKRRFVNEKFLASIQDWISDKTEFIFQTDQKPLFEETQDVLNNSVFNKIELFDDSPFGIQTDWEMAKVKAGDEIFRMKFWKKSPVGG